MADDWEVVVPSRAVSPAPLSLASPDASHQDEATESHAPAMEEGSDLTVFAAPWATPTKPGSTRDAPEQPSPEAEASRLGGSAVFVSPPPPSQEDGSPSVATPMQVVKPAMADSDSDPEADMMSSSIDSDESTDSEFYYSNGMSSGAMTLVLLGKTGNGKSSTGNTILDRKVFEAKRSASSVTGESKAVEGLVEGRHITVVDTPGLFDGTTSEEQVRRELDRALDLAAEGAGPVVLLLVLSAGCKFTGEEAACLRALLAALGPAAPAHSILVFTRGDELEADDTPLYEFLRDSPPYLKDVLEKVDGRVAVINNRDAGSREQVAALLATADALVEANQGAVLPLPRQLASPHAAPLSREPSIGGDLVRLAEQLRESEEARRSLQRRVRDGPKGGRRHLGLALTACGLLTCKLLLGGSARGGGDGGMAPFKVGGGGVQVYNLYGPCTWSIDPQELLPPGAVLPMGVGPCLHGELRAEVPCVAPVQ